MKLLKVNPHEIVTLNDFPVNNLHILKIYFKIYKEGHENIIPPCPIIEKRLIAPYFKKELKELFKQFESKNPSVRYFLLDGSHKTSAATLTHNQIKAMIFESDKDIEEARKLVETGDLFSLTVNSSIKNTIKFFNKHFNKKIGFYTVEQKAQRMAKEKVIPDYMIKYYKKYK